MNQLWRAAGLRRICACAIVTVGAVSAVSPRAAADGTYLCDSTKPSKRPAAAPKYSDVGMRLFRKHKGGAEIEAGKAFVVDGSSELSVTARARPGDRDAPVVMQLVEWGRPAPAELILRTAALFGGKALKVKLLVPSKYDEAVHEEAEKTKDYSKLAVEQNVRVSVGSELTRVDLPPLNPWGMLVVKKAE